jgi:excisionase family DNA binding protein
MPRGKTATVTRPSAAPPAVANTPVDPAGTGDVLTLAEAAAYLRVAEGDVLRTVREQKLPGRLIAGQWRFLKAAIQDWLRSAPPRGSTEALLRWAGAFKDDPDLEEIVREAYRKRGRPITSSLGGPER